MSRLRLVSKAPRSLAPDTVRAIQAKIGFLSDAGAVRAFAEDWKSADDGFAAEAEALGASEVFVLDEEMDLARAEAVRVAVQRLLALGEVARSELPEPIVDRLVALGVIEEVNDG